MDRNELFRRLTILDSKCASLLQLSAVVLALNMITVSVGTLDGLRQIVSVVIALIFLLTCFLSIFVIWVNWEASEGTLKRRTLAYRVAVVIATIGLICMVVMTILSLAGR